MVDVWQGVRVVVVGTAIGLFNASQDSACSTRYSYVQSSLICGIKVAYMYCDRWFKNFLLLTSFEMLCFSS